jgi:hypothetical protein
MLSRKKLGLYRRRTETYALFLASKEDYQAALETAQQLVEWLEAFAVGDWDCSCCKHDGDDCHIGDDRPYPCETVRSVARTWLNGGENVHLDEIRGRTTRAVKIQVFGSVALPGKLAVEQMCEDRHYLLDLVDKLAEALRKIAGGIEPDCDGPTTMAYFLRQTYDDIQAALALLDKET